MANYLLRRAREEKGWTQRHLAEEIGVSEQAVRSWERGTRTPSLEMRNRLCHALEKSPLQLGLQRAEPVNVDEPLRQDLLLTHHIDSPDRSVPERIDVNRSRMLKRVWSIWIEGVLKRSLYQETLIVLGLQEQPDALINPWRLEVQETSQPPHPIPPGTSILDIYDGTDGNLLVLGAPGAGKTTLLLDLARQLLDRAKHAEQHPIPVVFNLASWAEKRSTLEDWLVQELATKYQVPRAVGKTWVASDRLLLLLDGLDEVAMKDRGACIDALNTYRLDHGLVPIVVCCRSAEYFSLRNRALLSRAVVVQPLTHSQIDAYLSSIGTPLLAMREALQHDPLLQEMASTPLMLNILTLTYHGLPSQKMLTVDTLAECRRLVFREYVERMIHHRSLGDYSPQQTNHWLAWLAFQLTQHNQTEIYLERIQPVWLPDSKLRQRYYHTVVRVIYGSTNMVLAGLFGWLRGGETGVGKGLLGKLGSGPGSHVLGWMAPGLGGGLEGGGTIGLLLAITAILMGVLVHLTPGISAQVKQPQIRIWQSLTNGLRNGLKTGFVIGVFTVLLLFGLNRNLTVGLSYGGAFGLIGGLIVGLISGLVAHLQDKSEQNASSKERRTGRLSRFVDALVVGLCACFGFVIVDGLLVGSRQGITYGVIIGIFSGLFFGIEGRISSNLIRDLDSTIRPAEMVTWSWESAWRNLGRSLRRGLTIGISILISVSVTLGCASTLFHGLAYGLRYGLALGPIVGLTVGIASTLSILLNSGWSSNILDEHQLSRPNEGIRRSARNSMLTALIIGPVGGIASGFISGIAFALVGVTGWFTLGIGFAIVFTIVFAFFFWNVYGGDACIEHFVLRWYLWRHGAMPWNYVHFLDYAAEHILLRKVGGGYIFIHRLLLDYFAALDAASLEKEPDARAINISLSRKA